MHELSVGQAIIETVLERAADRKVERVDVRIGHLRQVVPDSLQLAWQVLIDGTDLAGCELVIHHVAAVVHCRACDTDSVLDLPILLCASCNGYDVTLTSGEEFDIASFDVASNAR